MTSTPRLDLPALEAGQAQKHVTMNEALLRLDAAVQLSVADRDLTAPPASPAIGARYLVAAGATGAWAGADGTIACERDGGWDFLAPRAGWLCWVGDESRLLVHTGTAFVDVAAAAGWPTAATLADGTFPRLGVATAADATNRFAVKSDAALFACDEAAGSGHMRLAIDKAVAARDAAIVFETGWSGRALLGLLGGDDFSIKTSADGATWTEALRIAAATGRTTLPAGGLDGGGRLTAQRLFTASGTWTRPSGVRFALVWALGAGGGGGGAAGAAGSGAAGGGGGAGGLAVGLLDVTAIASRSVTIGSAGSAGAAGATGGTGGTTSFGTDVVATGGVGGAGMAAGTYATAVTGGLAGTGTTGDLRVAGSPGGAGLRLDAGNVLSGSGGTTHFGGGGRGNVGTVAGAVAASPGAGGSGGAVASSATGQSGGAGGAGLVWIWEFE